MDNFKILNSKETKDIMAMLVSQFGFSGRIEFAFLRNKDDIYIISKDLAKIDASKFRINNLGLYFGNIKNNSIRLSIDATNLFGKFLSKSILLLDDSQASYWMRGDDLLIDSSLTGYVIIKHKNDFLGTGYIKGRTLLNYIPKERRLKRI